MEVHEPRLREIEQVFYPLGTRLSANSYSVDTYSIKALKCGDERNKKGPVQNFRGNLTYGGGRIWLKICIHIIE